VKLFLVPALAALIVIACVGWGRLIESWVAGWGGGPRLPPLSTGVVACIGLAGFLCGVGAFVAADFYTPLFAWLWVVAGCALAIRLLIPRWDRGWRALVPGGPAAAAFGVLAIVAVWETGGSLGLFKWNPCDDFVGYLPLLERLAETGGLMEPFSLRRVAGLGGGTVADSLFAAPFGLEAAYATDFVVGGLLVGLLLIAPASSWLRFALGALLTISFVLWQILKANLTPAYIAAALIAAVVLLIAETRRDRDDLTDRRFLVLAALLCAGLLTLRTPDPVPVALLLITLILGASATARERLAAILFFAAATVIFAGPWMIALWRSSGTPLYPPIAGNFNNSWPGLEARGEGLLSRLTHTLGADPLAWMLGGVLIAGSALIFLRRSSDWARAPLLAACSAVVSAVALVVLTGAAPHDLARYTWPFFAGVLIAALALLAGEVRWPLRGAGNRLAAAAVAGVAILIPIVSPLGDQIDGGATGVANVISGDDDSLVTIERFRYEYGVAQGSTPRGTKLAISTDTPWYFDYRRNDLVNLDQLGAVSPPPHMPLGGPTEATTDYLRDEGFDFVIATDPEVSLCLYNEKAWRINVARDEPEETMAPDFLDWFGWLREREREAPRLATHYASLIVFDLRRE
jgi:hypothetical protein